MPAVLKIHEEGWIEHENKRWGNKGWMEDGGETGRKREEEASYDAVWTSAMKTRWQERKAGETGIHAQ